MDSSRGHAPVLLEAAIAALAIRADGVYVDGTYGRGGHSEAICAQLGSTGRLIAIDRDPTAVAAGRRWGGVWNARVAAAQAGQGTRVPAVEQFVIAHATFSQLDQVLEANDLTGVDGLLLDLGVSSPQLDDPSRGFSFRLDGPLDMRMDPTRGMSARDWLMQATENQIKEALRDYGEERIAVPIAAAIVARRRDAGSTALSTTRELARLVASVVRRRQGSQMGKDPATRTFQALRILVNQELEELALVLDKATARLNPAGRLVVISFHSLEDRIVKQFIARESGRLDEKVRRDPIRGTPIFENELRLRSLGRVLPDAAETAANPRSRSAVMRVAQRLGEPQSSSLQSGAATTDAEHH